eukprot:4892147-Amphidinium_carterae.1
MALTLSDVVMLIRSTKMQSTRVVDTCVCNASKWRLNMYLGWMLLGSWSTPCHAEKGDTTTVTMPLC